MKTHDVTNTAVKAPVTKRIKSLRDAIKELGENHELVRKYQVVQKMTTFGVSFIACHKLEVIAEALNEGWSFDHTNADEHGWIPNFGTKKHCSLKPDWRGTAYDFGEFAYYGGALKIPNKLRTCDTTNFSPIPFGYKHVLKSEELADYFGSQFLSIWADYLHGW